MKQINTILLLPTKPIHTNYCRQVQNILAVTSNIKEILELQYGNNLMNRNNATSKFKYTIFRIVHIKYDLLNIPMFTS